MHYVPYTEVSHNSAFVFTDANNQEMFTSEFQYESMRISNQLTANGYIHEMVEKIEEVDIAKENEIPSLASLYLTDNEKVTTSTIEGEDMNLDIYLTNYSWRNELTIVYKVDPNS